MNPVQLGAFDEDDREVILGLLARHDFQAGAKTELDNWSAGLPTLFLSILNQISESPVGPVGPDAVNQAAFQAAEQLHDVLADLWLDCPAGARDLYLQLIEKGEMSSADFGRQDCNCLVQMGFARQVGKKMKAGCRMLGHYVQGLKASVGSLGRLFGSWECYQDNIRGLLERRLAHISRFDDRLYHLVERSLDDIPRYPDDCLNNLTGIRDRALELIWQREFGTSRRVPSDVVAYWTLSPRSRHKQVQGMMDSNSWDVPSEPLDQIRLLSLLTGSYRGFESKAKAVSKDAYILIDALHNFRNRTQHPDGQAIHFGVAVAALMACLELLACLERELQN